MPSDDSALERDVKLLSELVDNTSRLLEWTTERVLENPAAPVNEFKMVLPEILDRLKWVEDEIRSIRSQRDPRWIRLENAGLTGEQISWKAAIRNWIGLRTKGAVLPALKWTNNFLGSLTSVFPPLEIVKEYKEGLELVVEHQSDMPNAPREILGLR